MVSIATTQVVAADLEGISLDPFLVFPTGGLNTAFHIKGDAHSYIGLDDVSRLVP